MRLRHANDFNIEYTIDYSVIKHLVRDNYQEWN
jgi:hypothetical protein